MNSSSELASAPAVERATAQKGLKVGRSTVQRVKDGDTTVNLDYIEVFAKVFHKEPWQLLHPAIGEMASSTDATPTLAQALEVVAAALSSVPVEKRQALLGVLATYASDPVQESNSLSYLQSELAKTQARAGVHPSSIATGQPPGGKV